MKTLCLIAILISVLATISAEAFTFTNRQVTTSELKQTNAVMFGNSVYWRQWYSGQESNIWEQNTQTSHEQPVVERLSEKTPVSASGDYLVYHEYKDETNWYDTGIYNFVTSEDKVIASGSENQVAQDIWENYVIYSDGFSLPNLALCDITSKTTRFIASEAIRPRIWGNTIVWMESAGGGYCNVMGYDLITSTKYYIPNSSDGRQSYPDIWQDRVVWKEGVDRTGIFYKNLTTGEERKIAESGEFPTIWGDFVAWSQDDGTGAYDIYAHNLTTSITLKVSGEAQTSGWEPYGAPYIYENTVLWTSGVANGYGNIFSAELNSVPEPSGLITLGALLTPLLALRRRKRLPDLGKELDRMIVLRESGPFPYLDSHGRSK